jgi:hypothetical protein
MNNFAQYRWCGPMFMHSKAIVPMPKHQSSKYGGMKSKLQVLLTLALKKGRGMLHGPAIYLREKGPGAKGVEVCCVHDLAKSTIVVRDVE